MGDSWTKEAWDPLPRRGSVDPYDSWSEGRTPTSGNVNLLDHMEWGKDPLGGMNL